MPATEPFHAVSPPVETQEEKAAPRQFLTRMERRQRALAEIGRQVLRETTAESFFLEATRIAARTLDADFAGLVQTRNSGLLLQWTLAESRDPTGELAALLPHEPASSAWAFALHTKQPLTMSDLRRETRFETLLHLEAGASAGVICPLGAGPRMPGAIGLFAAHARVFAEDEAAFLESVAVLLASAAARRQAERALADQAQFISTAVDSLDGLVVVLSPTGAIEKVNDACRWMSGLADDDVVGKMLWESLLPADRADAVREAFDRLRQGEAVARLDALLRNRDGRPRRILWTFTIVQREDGRLQAIVGSGVEAKNNAAAEQRLRQIDPRAQKNQVVLAELEQCLREGRTPPPAVLEELFQLHDLHAEGEPYEGNQREYPRKPYPYVQRIAPWSGGRLPSDRAFEEVLCRDISPSGVSFFFPRRPNFDRVVVSLGPPENRVYVVAEVRHVAPMNVDGKSTFAVGCQFLARVYY